jgi:Zn-dependent peptidase ImmA (M78 family)
MTRKMVTTAMPAMGKTRLDWKMEETLMERAGDAAEEILRFARQRKAPIDPLQIAAEEIDRLRVVGDDFKKAFDGQLEYHPKKKRFLLFYNNRYDRGLPAGEHHPRTRFSIAHELGHFYLERHNRFLRRGGRKHGSKGEFSNDYITEREADSFAARLLMPGHLVEPMVNEGELSLDRIEEIAGTFKTSMLSTARRSVAVSDFPCAVVGIRNGLIAWVCRPNSLIKYGFYPPSRGHFTSKAAHEQWRNFQMGIAQRHTAPVYARQWFKVYDRTELEQVSVTEHYLPIPILDTLVVMLTIPEDELRLISNYD